MVQIVLDVKRSHFIIITIMFVLTVFTMAKAVSSNVDWHPLSQVSKTSSDSTSVDLDNNGNIDYCEESLRCDGITTSNNGITWHNPCSANNVVVDKLNVDRLCFDGNCLESWGSMR